VPIQHAITGAWMIANTSTNTSYGSDAIGAASASRRSTRRASATRT
jgi:hypothetical protein